jgi:hypothetical protein
VLEWTRVIKTSILLRISAVISDREEVRKLCRRASLDKLSRQRVIADLNDNSVTRFFSLFIACVSGLGRELCADLCSTISPNQTL